MATNRTFNTAVTSGQEVNAGRSALYGAGAGIVGGIVFGLMMQLMMPMILPMIGKIIGLESVAGGWLYHLFNSAAIGAIFGLAVLAVSRMTVTYGAGALLGGLYGVVWWILGPLILMPLLLGMTQMMFAINNNTLMSLVGHIVYGVITGVVYVFLRGRFTT